MPEPERPVHRGESQAADASPDAEPAVYEISDARPSLDAEMHQRMRRYLVSMSIRTVCFILAVVFHGWIRWAFAAAAIILPYVAVVMANAGPRKGTRPRQAYSPPRQALGEADRHTIGPSS